MSEKCPIDNALMAGYPVELMYDKDTHLWVILCQDLPGCNAQGETINDAIESFKESAKMWMECVLEQNMEIPPVPDESLSHRWWLRGKEIAKLQERVRVLENPEWQTGEPPQDGAIYWIHTKYTGPRIAEYWRGRFYRCNDMVSEITDLKWIGPIPEPALEVKDANEP